MAKPNAIEPLKRLKKLISLEREDISLILLLTFGYGLLTIATPVAVQTLVNNVIIGGVIQPLIVVTFILLVILLLASFIYLTEVYLVEIIQRRIFVRSALRISNNISGANIDVYDENNSVELMNRFFDVMTVQKATATLLTVSLTAMLQGIIGSIILLFYSAYFAAAIILCFIILSFIIIGLGKSAEYTAIKESASKYKMAAWLENMAKNVTLSKFFLASKRNIEETDKLASEYLVARQKHFGILLKQQIAVFTLYAVMGTAILVLSGLLVIWGIINLGQFVAAELIIFGVLASFVRFITKLETFYDMLAALDKLGILYDLPQERINNHQPTESINVLNVEHLSFSHIQNVPLIEDVSFSIKRGQSIAIVGDSGTGKSGLIELLSGMREFNRGTITYNGIDIRQIDLNFLRNEMALAGNIEVIDGSILDNLKLARTNVTLEEVNAVLDLLDLMDDISVLDNGIESQLTGLGKPLSTTQLQRLMLARALIGQPSIIFIDGLLDTLTQVELGTIISLLKTYQLDSMVIVTTRHQHIADLFDQKVTLSMGEI
jgi:putative ABC transport system ATP-binding protein